MKSRALRENDASDESSKTGLPTFELVLPPALVEVVAERAAQILAARLPGNAEDRFMSVDQAAEYLACKPRRIYDLHSQRRLRSHKDGSRLLFRRSDLDAYVEAGS